MKKRFAFPALLAALGLTLAGCSGAVDTGSSDTSAGDSGADTSVATLPESCSGDNPYLAVLLPNQTNPYYVAMKAGFEEEGAAKGFDVEVQIADDDDAKQLSQAEAMLEKDPCAMALNAVKSEPAAAIVKAANDKGVPVFSVNVTLDENALAAQGATIIQYLGADNYAGDVQSAEAVLADFGDDADLKIGFVSEPDEVPVQIRDQGFEETIAANPNAEVVTKVDGNVKVDDSLRVTTEMLSGNPDINVIFASTGPAAQGALEAVRTDNLDVKVYGFCPGPDVSTNDSDFPFCVPQEPRDYGIRVVDQIRDYVDGNDVDAEVLRPLKEFKKGETPGEGEVG